MKTNVTVFKTYGILAIAGVLYILSWVYFFMPPFGAQNIADSYEKTFIWGLFQLMFFLGFVLFHTDPKAITSSLGAYLIKCMIFSAVLLTVLYLPISLLWSLGLYFLFGAVLFDFSKAEETNWQVHVAATICLCIVVYLKQGCL